MDDAAKKRLAIRARNIAQEPVFARPATINTDSSTHTDGTAGLDYREWLIGQVAAGGSYHLDLAADPRVTATAIIAIVDAIIECLAKEEFTDA